MAIVGLPIAIYGVDGSAHESSHRLQTGAEFQLWCALIQNSCQDQGQGQGQDQSQDQGLNQGIPLRLPIRLPELCTHKAARAVYP